MSAYMVSKEHIDAMVTAALELRRPNDHCARSLSWKWRDNDDDETRDGFREGEPWGPGVADVYSATFHEITEHPSPDDPTHVTPGYVGAMLWAENRRSVDHRYAESEIEEPYVYKHNRGWTAVEILSAIACFEYQSCEHPGWDTSEARRFCETLVRHCVRLVPGYSDGPWEINHRGTSGAPRFRKERAEQDALYR